MRIPHCARGLVLGALILAGPASTQAQAPLWIYTDNLVNAFQDWSWGARNFSNTSPVHSGNDSISASFVAWNGLSFYHPDLDTSLYSSLTFWANGGSTGGQIIRVYLQLDDTNQMPNHTLPALPTNSWQQFSIPLTVLGADNKSNLIRLNLQLTSFGSTNTFYIDDVQLTAKPAPAVVHLSVSATQAVRSVEARWFGINAVMWDSYFDTPQTIAKLQEMGTLALRCLGGSLSDEYHWVTDTSGTNTWRWGTSFANFLHVATNVGVKVVTTVNYGTGSTNEAAAWVAYANGSTTNTLALGTDQFGANWQTACAT